MPDTPPTIPGSTLLTINGGDTAAVNRLISAAISQTLAWSVSTDVDSGQNVTHEVQVSSRSDFSTDPETGLSSIVSDQNSISSGSILLNPVLPPGQYYWRVRGYDGELYSGWSRIGMFRVNRPPKQPTGLLVADAS
jgi:hypothetical protein